MKVSYSHVDPMFREPLDAESQRHVEKLGRLLKKYSPDLVQLHGALERAPRTQEFSLSLNLVLPTGTLHAAGSGSSVRASAKAAFAEIELQLKKHQQKLRKDYVWKRKRPRASREAPY